MGWTVWFIQTYPSRLTYSIPWMWHGQIKSIPLNSFLEVLAYSWPNWQPITQSGPLRLRYDLTGTVCVESNLNHQTTGHTSWIIISIVYFKTACLIICHVLLCQGPPNTSRRTFHPEPLVALKSINRCHNSCGSKPGLRRRFFTAPTR